MNRTKTAMGAASVAAVLIGLTAGCTPTLSSSGARPPVTIPASAATNPASAATDPASAATAPANAGPASASASATGFVPIDEPGNPGPAQIEPAPADCYSQKSTVDIEQCFEAKTESTDAEIDAVQQARYDSASPSGRAAILAQDRAWLNARGMVCQVAFHTGGSIDLINVSACLLDESTARLDAVKGITPPEAMLRSTDSPDADALNWYTTPEGSRIAELDTQGDESGGVVIGWFVIGGANGFVVNPAQFYFKDGSYTNSGVIQPPGPTYHRVGTGQEYSFSIDYTHLSAAPTGNPARGFVYAPGAPVAIWN